MEFNKEKSKIMHIDLNSCFATIEQQANPFLREKPIAIAAYDSPGGCILAPSIEAKEYGIKTGMRVKEGKNLCPGLIVKIPDPDKYRDVHIALRGIMKDYTNDFFPKSIDEFVLNLKDYSILQKGSLFDIGKEIKKRIKNEIGEWITVSMGIASNRFLAKTASSLHKPDGLDEINYKNYIEIYKKLKLRDLCGISYRNEARLNSVGIYSVVDFFNSPLWKLKAAFHSISSYYWYLRLRGWEIDSVEFKRRSYGNSFALPKPLTKQELGPILTKLTEKMCFRLRKAGYKTQGIHLAIWYRDWNLWHKSMKTKRVLFDTKDIYRQAFTLLSLSPKKPIRTVAVSCFNLTKEGSTQLDLLEDVIKKENLIQAVDDINDRWGDFVVTSARMVNTNNVIHDRIAFGGVKELDEIIL